MVKIANLTRREKVEAKRINRNLKQAIRRAKKNTNPLKIGKNSETGKPIYIKGKTAQRERIRNAKAKAFYQMSTKVYKTQSTENERYQIDARKFDFKSRKQYDNFMKYHNATAQRQILSDKGNSLRKSFRTMADNLELSSRVRGQFEQQFQKLNDYELLRLVEENRKNHKIDLNYTFDSDQPIDDNSESMQAINMMRLMGLTDEAAKFSSDDINTGLVDNANFTHIDFDKIKRRENRRDQGRV